MTSSNRSSGPRPAADARVAEGLLHLAWPVTGALNPYLSSYLAEHVALGGHWSALGARPNVIDRLNIDELTSTVLRREFGRSTIPAVVAGVVMNRGAVRGSSLLDRIILRCIGVSQIDGVAVAAGVTAADVPVGSAVVWSRRWHCDPLSVPLTGHTNWGAAVAAVPLPDGRTLLATTSDETVRLWDPITGTPVGDPLTGHTDGVTAVAAVPLQIHCLQPRRSL